jgi:hypothetical protein
MKLASETKNIHDEVIKIGDIVWYSPHTRGLKNDNCPAGFVSQIEEYNVNTILVTCNMFNPQHQIWGPFIVRHVDHFTITNPASLKSLKTPLV